MGLAEAQVIKGDFAAALPDLVMLTKYDPKNAAAWHLLSRAYQGLHRTQEAKQAEAKATASEKE
jgi:predicted Zn-dependent protease